MKKVEKSKRVLMGYFQALRPYQTFRPQLDFLFGGQLVMSTTYEF